MRGHELPRSSPNVREKTYKVILVGNTGVGKSALLQRATSGSPVRDGVLPATIGVDFKVVPVSTPLGPRGDALVKLQVWDTAGQERYRSIVPNFFRSTHAVVFFYDISNRGTFDAIPAWIRTFREARYHLDTHVICWLVGSKADLTPGRREVTAAQGAALAESLDMAHFLEVSALLETAATLEAVLFEPLAAAILEEGMASYTMTPGAVSLPMVKGDSVSSPGKGWKRCCALS